MKKNTVKVEIEKLKLYVLYFLEKAETESVHKIILELSPLMSLDEIREVLNFVKLSCECLAIKNNVDDLNPVFVKGTDKISDCYVNINRDIEFNYKEENYNKKKISEKAIELAEKINGMYNI